MYGLRHAKGVFTLSKNADFSLSARNIFSFGFGKSKKKEDAFKEEPCGKFTDKGAVSHVNPPCYDLTGLCLPKIIIIGGGLAGMCAADCLIKANIQDVMILEASDRLGGRIYSTWSADTNVELGPTELAGASLANPVFNLANASKALVEKVAPEKLVFLTGDCRFITDYGMEKLIFDQLLEDAKVTGKSRLKTNLLQFLALRVQQELLRLPPSMRFDTERVLYGMINSMRGSHGTCISRVSAASLSESTEIPGSTVRLQSGMTALLSSLIAAIPREKFLMGKAVDKVMNVDCPEPGKRVKVVCCDGDSYNADFVISTLPIGVLKAKGARMFAGNLNPNKQNAIDKIGCGLQNNIYFEFTRPWWPTGDCSIRMAWSVDELENRKSWTKGISTISGVPGSKCLLRVAIAGSEAELIENCSEEELAFDFTTLMRKMTGDPSLPYPNGVLMSRWLSNPFSKGATVYMGIDTTPGMFNDLAGGSQDESCGGPPPSTVLFAGDATVSKHFGTLVGAKMSGVREATRIIEAVKRGNDFFCQPSRADEQQQLAAESESEQQQACSN